MFPEDVSVHGHLVDELFMLALTLTSVAFVAVVGILGYCLVRYRSGAGPAFYTHGRSGKALALTLGLALTVFVGIDVNLAVNDHGVFEEMFGHPPDPAESVRIRVTGEQFLWTFRYPGRDGEFDTFDDVVTTATCTIPVGRPVLFSIRSRDVLHSFFMPVLRIKQDAVPGMETYLYSEATKAGRYEIACAELCGFGHYAMKGRLEILEAAEFDAWMAAREAELAGPN